MVSRKKIFVSCQSIGEPLAQVFLHALRDAGLEVEHSPSPPISASNPELENWYDSRLSEAITRANYFVAIVDYGWDSSTWMAIEGETAHNQTKKRSLPMFSFIATTNPVTNLMTAYVGETLPLDAKEAAIRIANYDSD